MDAIYGSSCYGGRKPGGRKQLEGKDSCSGFFGLLGRVLKVVLPNVSPVSVAGNFRGQHPQKGKTLLES